MTVRVSITDTQIDPAEQAAQRVTDGLADLLTESKLTNNLDRQMMIWRWLRELERLTANVSGTVGDRAAQLCDHGYGHGV